MKTEWIEFCSIFFFASGGIISLGIGVWFNIQTAIIARKIQHIYQKKGQDWCFWSNYDTKLKFIFAPEKLLEPGDSEELLAAKQALVNHGKKIIKYVVLAVAALIMGGILTILVPIVAALNSQHK